MRLSDWITRRFLIELGAVCIFLAGLSHYTGRHWTSTTALIAFVIATGILGQYARMRAVTNFERDRNAPDTATETRVLAAATGALLRQLGAHAAFLGAALGMLPLLWLFQQPRLEALLLCLTPIVTGVIFVRTWRGTRLFGIRPMRRSTILQCLSMGLVGVCAGLFVPILLLARRHDLAFAKQMTVMGYSVWTVLMFGGLAIGWLIGLLVNRTLAWRAERRMITYLA